MIIAVTDMIFVCLQVIFIHSGILPRHIPRALGFDGEPVTLETF